jgi:hypothetical protein
VQGGFASKTVTAVAQNAKEMKARNKKAENVRGARVGWVNLLKLTCRNGDASL